MDNLIMIKKIYIITLQDQLFLQQNKITLNFKAYVKKTEAVTKKQIVKKKRSKKKLKKKHK